jgi:hypothetical protein
MPSERSDAETVAGFMAHPQTGVDAGRWWTCVRVGRNELRYVPQPLDLDAIHLVEAKLSEEQRIGYMLELSKGGPPEKGYWRLIHASAEVKLRCLAAVIRGGR